MQAPSAQAVLGRAAAKQPGDALTQSCRPGKLLVAL